MGEEKLEFDLDTHALKPKRVKRGEFFQDKCMYAGICEKEVK